MFSAALARKHFPVPPEDIPAMLAIHNSLNEQVWAEIMGRWESKYEGVCGERRRLKRFQGRPGVWSPLAWYYWVSRGVVPYDRHDWVVERCGREVRYVIDYYESGGQFSCVIRPALDSVNAAWARITDYFS
jgi:cytochrome c heme-lyase